MLPYCIVAGMLMVERPLIKVAKKVPFGVALLWKRKERPSDVG